MTSLGAPVLGHPARGEAASGKRGSSSPRRYNS